MSFTLLGHLLICTGPACSNNTARDGGDKPAIDAKQLVAKWKEHRLYRFIHLTLTGCLGQCNRANQGALLTSGKILYLEHLESEADAEQLIQWALRCRDAQTLLPLPVSLERKNYQRLAPCSKNANSMRA